MKEYLSQKQVSFEELDVAADEQARNEMVAKTGMSAVPVIDIDGEVIVGFDREAIERYLQKAVK